MLLKIVDGWKSLIIRGGSRAAATTKTECFVIIVNGWKPLTVITKHSILDAAAALGLSLIIFAKSNIFDAWQGSEYASKHYTDSLM